jgi:diguanylate cyclase (GGDEF)-like protein/PAS domain S-box-containing protein
MSMWSAHPDGDATGASYRALFESNPWPMWVFDPATLRVLAVNETAVARYGYTRAEFLASTLHDFRPAEDAAALPQQIADLDPSGTTTTRTRHRLKDGRTIVVDVTGYPIEWDGRPARLALAVDVTRQVAAERALRESERLFRAVVENMSEALVITDTDDVILHANERLRDLLGFDIDELLGRRAIDALFGPEVVGGLRERHARRLVGESERFEAPLRRRDGSEVWVEVSAAPYRDEAGTIIGTMAAITDITSRREAEDALRQSEERYRTVLDDVREVVFSTDADGRWSYLSRAWEPTSGRTVEESIGRPSWSEVHEEDRPRILAAMQALRGAGRPFRSTLRYVHPGGGVRWVEIRSRPVRDAAGRIVGAQGTLNDVTDRKRAEEAQAEAVSALQRSEARLRAILDHAAIGISEVDLEGRILHANPAFQRILGYSREELLGRVAASLSPAEDSGITRDPVRELIAGRREVVNVEKRFVRKDGHEIWVNLVISRIEDELAPTRIVGMLQDVSERKALEAQLTRQAFHDPLTGLANRALFRDRVGHALERDVRGAEGIAVLFMDLDGFKTVNDGLGHEAGDRLLVAVGARLAQCMRAGDTVARLGGDEFGILVEKVDDDALALGVAERELQAIRAPLYLDGHEVFVGASIGVAFGRDAESADDLLRNADVAMYTAKGAGKGRYALFEPAMYARAVERQQLEAELRPALERGEFRVVYQPIVELATGRVMGVEALVRWQHPTKGIIQPCRFIGAMEETGLIVPVGRWVLREACARAAAWRERLAEDAESEPPFTISVNISGRQLKDEAFVGELSDVLRETGLPASALVLEITESVLMADLDATTERLAALRALGVRLAIDDFGTGYSSLSYLQRFPVDVLKIDKSFTDGIGNGPHDAALVRTIVALSSTLHLRTVAEGIEQPEQRAALEQLGCEMGQGYHFARPMGPEEVERMLRARHVAAA